MTSELTTLLPDVLIRTSGTGPIVELDGRTERQLHLTLDIRRITERGYIDLSVWASPDGLDWGSRPIARIPRKFYCGTSHYDLELPEHSSVRFLKVEYRVSSNSLALIGIAAEAVPEQALAAAY